jgi:hypothetical protein
VRAKFVDAPVRFPELGRKQEAEALFQELPNLMGETAVLRTGNRDVQQPAQLASAYSDTTPAL